MSWVSIIVRQFVTGNLKYGQVLVSEDQSLLVRCISHHEAGALTTCLPAYHQLVRDGDNVMLPLMLALYEIKPTGQPKYAFLVLDNAADRLGAVNLSGAVDLV